MQALPDSFHSYSQSAANVATVFSMRLVLVKPANIWMSIVVTKTTKSPFSLFVKIKIQEV